MEGPKKKGASSQGSSSSGNKRMYTGRGDQGSTLLYNQRFVHKDSDAIQCMGCLEELEAILGLANEHCKEADNGLNEHLCETQSRLKDILICVGTPRSTSKEHHVKLTSFPQANVERVERWIDTLESELPQSNIVVLPSGGLSSAHLNVARTVCRRAERLFVPLLRCGDNDEVILRYLNRLSDFLFLAGKYASIYENINEEVYRKPSNANNSLLLKEPLAGVGGSNRKKNEKNCCSAILMMSALVGITCAAGAYSGSFPVMLDVTKLGLL